MNKRKIGLALTVLSFVGTHIGYNMVIRTYRQALIEKEVDSIKLLDLTCRMYNLDPMYFTEMLSEEDMTDLRFRLMAFETEYQDQLEGVDRDDD